MFHIGPSTSNSGHENGARNSRRLVTCAECHSQFKSKQDLLFHVEACLMEAFENEAMAVVSDISLMRSRQKNQSSTQPGITVTVTGKQTEAERVEIHVSSPHCAEGGDDDIVEEKPSTHMYSVMREPETIEGPSGLRLMVSVEKQENQLVEDGALLDEDDAPPQLEVEATMEEDDEGEGNGMEDYEEDVSDTGVQHTDGDRKRRHEPDDDCHESGTTSGVQSMTNQMYLGGRAPVIGALANANDDPYKPKMECPVCGLVLYRHNFAAHYRIHTGELPFGCSYCSKRFRTSSTLKVHIRAHTGEKPYSCPQCVYATITRRNLDRHIIQHHINRPILPGPITRKSRYRDGNETDFSTGNEYAAQNQIQYTQPPVKQFSRARVVQTSTQNAYDPHGYAAVGRHDGVDVVQHLEEVIEGIPVEDGP